MSSDSQNVDNGSNGTSIIPELTEQTKSWTKHTNPSYQPAFERVELTEVRAPFWGMANHAMHEYFDERR
jgi:hypothetical protein